MSEENEDKLEFIKKFTRLDSVDEAEKEASEVLHSLLSVERIEKHEVPVHHHQQQHMQQMVVLNCTNGQDNWHSSVDQRLFAEAHHSDTFVEQNNSTIVWENSITVGNDKQEQSGALENTNENVVYEMTPLVNKKSRLHQNSMKKSVRKKYKSSLKSQGNECISNDSSFENDTHDVRARFKRGCECQVVSCFEGLSPENVHKHRLNIAELTKEEHDMYLMGVTMACISDPVVTSKQRERRRLRAQYVYQGRRVCLSAFLYLENCTLYQLKRIRKHVMTHGVTPRVHGNHGKKPHNVFSLETYRNATEFLKSYIKQHNIAPFTCKSTVYFAPEVSRKTIYNAYIQYLKEQNPTDCKILGYSTFRHFIKEQFPQLRFCKNELGAQNPSNNTSNSSSKQPSSNNAAQTNQPEEKSTLMTHSTMLLPPSVETCRQPSPLHTIISPSQMTTIPVIFSESNKTDMNQGQTAYIVTPVSQLVQTPYQQGHTITVTPAYAFTTL